MGIARIVAEEELKMATLVQVIIPVIHADSLELKLRIK